MTDSEIVKALELCATASGVRCHDCPYRKNDFERHCAFVLTGDALDLINRQQAKIEQLQELCGNADGYADALEEYTREKSIKEFAERLKEKAKNNKWNGTICGLDIDNLVKEMVGGAE